MYIYVQYITCYIFCRNKYDTTCKISIWRAIEVVVYRVAEGSNIKFPLCLLLGYSTVGTEDRWGGGTPIFGGGTPKGGKLIWARSNLLAVAISSSIQAMQRNSPSTRLGMIWRPECPHSWDTRRRAGWGITWQWNPQWLSAWIKSCGSTNATRGLWIKCSNSGLYLIFG